MYQLYYYPNNASFTPHLLLEELGFDFELVLVDRAAEGQKSAEYLKLNPVGRIPTLVDGDLVLFESPAICVYLCEKDSQSRFIPPPGHPDRPLFFQWLMFLSNTVQSELMIYFYPDKHTTDIAAAASISSAQDKRLVDMFEILDNTLVERHYLVGETASACDHFLLMVSIWAEDLSRPPLAFPNLGRYLRNITKRDAVRRVCKKERVNLDAYL